MATKFSIIVPVFNRPNEVDELLESLTHQTYTDFEVVIVEDGSAQSSDKVVEKFSDTLSISYYFKPNTGPGDSRNYGMRKAKGNYFIILDSDCILPPNYMQEVHTALSNDYVDCFGGEDAASDSFTDVQKAINFTMTSVLTTGGVRGSSEKLGKFQPRSFNMGISKKAFEASAGFGKIHPGEDPDLSMRLWKLGFQTRLFNNVYVFHKRRIDWSKFKTQVNKFGKARPILDSWHPEYRRITFWFPTLFLAGFIFSVCVALTGYPHVLWMYFLYFLMCFLISTFQNKSVSIGFLSVYAVAIQFWGYGTGFLLSFWNISVLNKKPQEAFPELFFR
ncbi:MAG: glycosyltransferase family 2 protein [Cyclobacteriaceae bacterium]|nr:glycosyltransferase family 2 protein [Cyclobacteriaceae bacterium]